ncbi:MAG: thiol reductant ABC exporter subunit CydC [Coriobacteriaceae bacterium]|nr:thiol reductant ABC exporter subunit CydC [Coriobacteriaceae bacterium]
MSTASLAARWKQAWEQDRWVRPFLKRYLKALLASLGLGLATMVFAAGLMFTSGFLISDAAEQPALGLFSLLVPLGLVQVFGVGKPFLGYLERLASHDWVLRLTSAMRTRLYRSLEREGVFWMATRKAGEVLGLLAGDIGHLQNLYLRCVFPLMTAWGLWLLASLLVGLFTPLFGLFMLLGLGVLALLMPLVSVLINGARQMRAKELSNRLYDSAADDVAGLADWTFSGRRDDYLARLMEPDAQLNAVEARSARSLRRINAAGQIVFCALSICLLCWAALHFGNMAQAAAATGVPARPADFIAAFVLGFFPLLEAFEPLPGAALQAGAHLDSLERLNALDEVEDDGDGSAAGPGSAQRESAAAAQAQGEAAGRAAAAGLGAEPPVLDFDDVSFAYPGQPLLLRGVSLRVKPGEKLAVLGPSGAGKSTLLSLARGDLSPTAGRVTLGGADTAALGDAICSQLGLIQQSTYLFNRSLFANLSLGDRSITRDAAAAALQAVGLGPLLASLPKGLDTMVSEAGHNFSGGERHRIALARVLLKDTPVVMLDEPTVSLDPLTEHALLEDLFTVLEGRSVVMVTHHLAGIERMDRVVFIEDGRIALEGSPAELARSSARFQQLLAFDREL